MNVRHLFCFFGILFLLTGCGRSQSIDASSVPENLGVVINVEEVPYTHTAALLDVTQGALIRGVTTEGAATGSAAARLVDGAYEVKATLNGLPDPEGDDFYEGWLVRESPQSIISTGPAIKINGHYEQSFMSAQDLRDHTHYILTLEPNDGDPAPAIHILDGIFVDTERAT